MHTRFIAHRSAFIVALALALPALSQTWVSRYDGPASDEDRAYGVAVDQSGCTYVTGTSWGLGTSYDAATVKYGLAGDSLWIRRFNGVASGSDEGRAIAVRGTRVAVTGGCADPSLYTDILTIVYDNSGDSLWTALYNGPGTGNDMGLAVALDQAGNVYVTGYAQSDTAGWDFVTLKYDAAGNRQWVATYSTEFEDFASCIGLDPAGNVYVTGSSGNPYLLTWDFATVKYNSSGVEQWAVRYDGPAGEDDEPHGLVVDVLGNVYVCGGSLDSTSGLDYVTIKYNPDGETLWVRRYNGPANGPDEAYAIGLDAAGNVYVTGSSQGNGTEADYATVKYDPDGNLIWVSRYNGPASGFDEAHAIVVDAGGYVTVTGTSQGQGTGADYATVRYTPAGTEEWVNRYDGPNSGYDEAMAMALDPTGGVCVTGASDGAVIDYATVRYPAVGITESPRPGAHGSQLAPTIIRGSLLLADVASGQQSAACAFLFDATGRTVADLEPGANDVSGLAPGVYFVAPASGAMRDASGVTKVIIAR
ncbi:MAG: SBBP repeat-containing protein [candidate division WOR-3 bacterium]